MNLNKEECHFYGGKRCRILTKMLCESGKCSFFKTTKKYREDLEKYPSIDYKALYESRHKNEVKINGEEK